MGFFDKIKKGLSRTKKNLVQNIESVITGRPHLDEEFLDDLEGVLLSGDLGFSTTEKVMKQNLDAKAQSDLIDSYLDQLGDA